jgi:hypothetical protein
MTRWPRRYGPSWRADEYNTLSLIPKGPEAPSIENAAAMLTADFEERDIDLEAVVVEGQLFLRGPSHRRRTDGRKLPMSARR